MDEQTLIELGIVERELTDSESGLLHQEGA